MESRAALIVAVATLLCGCGDDSTTSSPSDLGAKQDFGIALDMGSHVCAVVDVTAETDPKTGVAKKTAPALLTAVANVSGVVNPKWVVSRAGDATGFTPKATDASNLRVQFQADDPGGWTFQVSFDKGPCMGVASYTLGNPIGNKAVYRLRALPPESKGLPLTDVDLTVIGGTSQVKDIALQPGTSIQRQLTSGGVGTPGEVRLIADVGTDAVATTNALGSFTVAVQGSGMYTPLLIPQATTLAPHLGAKQQGALLATADFDVGAGATVSGSVTDPGAAALAGVRAVLRAGPLPSGAGTSNAGGAFTLHAEAANYTLSFGSDQWPQGTLAGVAVPGGGTSIAIQYTVARVAVGGTLVASDGTTAVAGARVSITSRPLGTVAQVSIGGAAATAVGGRVARVVTTDVAGALPAMQLPPGTYDVVIEPPFPSADGLTAQTLVVAGPTTWSLQLQPPLTLTGKIIGDHGQAVPNARVTAVEMVGLGAAPSTVSDAAGNYSIPKVDRGAPVTLLVEPDALSKQAGARVLLAAGTTTADVMLARGLLVTGTVLNGTQAVPAVTVQVLCWSCSSTTPLAESITDRDGAYFIYLPDPGEMPSDGGIE